jgi:hypothetical protein
MCEDFEMLMNNVSPKIFLELAYTNCRNAFPVNESTAVTLRFLATGGLL